MERRGDNALYLYFRVVVRVLRGVGMEECGWERGDRWREGAGLYVRQRKEGAVMMGRSSGRLIAWVDGKGCEQDLVPCYFPGARGEGGVPLATLLLGFGSTYVGHDDFTNEED